MTPIDAVAVRVLGCLIEKESTTPETYPLSLNAVVNACNQRSNREPVMDISERDAREAVEVLRAHQMAYVIEGSRVTKYSQRFSETCNLGRRELAALCPLLLRGAQTLGEIRDRSERLFSFADLEETSTVLERLSTWPSGPLVMRLPRQPGQKETRYVHLLSGEPSAEQIQALGTLPAASGSGSRLELLEAEIQSLRSEVEDLKRRLDHLGA